MKTEFDQGAGNHAGLPLAGSAERLSGSAAFFDGPELMPGSAAVAVAGRWRSRGYLPHVDEPGLCQSVTFRLHDSMPATVIQQWKQALGWQPGLPSDAPAAIMLHRRIVAYEDAGHGVCYMCDERIAVLVENALLNFDGPRYRLLAWCVMPNHVHVLLETFPGRLLASVVHSWKSFTAHEANKLLQRSGPFWAREYYDRYIRDARHLARAVAYIEGNPVAAGFVERAEEWKFSSARRRV